MFPNALEICIATLRQQKMLAVPIYYWDGTAWVDFQSLTNPQMATWVQTVTAGESIDTGTGSNLTKVVNRISTRNDW